MPKTLSESEFQLTVLVALVEILSRVPVVPRHGQDDEVLTALHALLEEMKK